MGDDGIIQKAEQEGEHHANGVKSEQEALDNLLLEYEIAMGEKSPNGKPTHLTVKSTNHTGTATEDTLGNPVYIPGGFKIASDSGKTVKEGIVIEDDDGNQFVWIPVSNINGDGSNKIKVDANTEVEITLGRYTFDTTTGAETKVQYGSEYAATTLAAVNDGTVSSYKAGSYYYELTDVRESNGSSGTDGTNTTAKDLAGFIDSVEENHGYYLARYEASYASGSTFGVGYDETYYKPASKISTNATVSSWTPSTATAGTLWNFITQGNASKACRQMYYGNNYVESDLVNSYAWDTAIVYIQAMGNSNYANQKDGNRTLKNTGSTGDEKCKIFDMASNCLEWTTEYCTNTTSDAAYPCTRRSGYFNIFDDYYTGVRSEIRASRNNAGSSFRVALYVK